MNDEQRAKALRKAELTFEQATEKAEAAKAARNAAVFEAIAARWSYEEIATAMGLSRQRVAQIAVLDPAYRPRRRKSS